MTPKELLIKANHAIKTNDLLLATELFTNILNKFPKHSGAKIGLQKIRKLIEKNPKEISHSGLENAISELQRGQFQKAINISLNLKLRDPNNPIIYNVIGISYVNLQKPIDAIPYFKTALRLDKKYSEAKANLGSALLLTGSTDDAITQLEQSLSENPNNPMAWNSLGNAFNQKSSYKNAQKSFEKAIKLSPKYINAINSLGVLLSKIEERDEAINTFEKGLKINPNDTDLLTNLGYALADAGEIDQAIKLLTKVISQGQYSIDVKHRLGILKSNDGDLKGAINLLREVIQEDPELSEAYRSLSLINKFENSDPLIERMRSLLGRSDATNYNKIHLGFAVGKSLHDIGRYSEAFEAYKTGNDTRRLELEYDRKEHSNSIEKIKSRYFNQDVNLEIQQRFDPIFIVGMNRSGTTLVEQILSSHSEVHGGGELAYINKIGLENLQNDSRWTAKELNQAHQEYIKILSKDFSNGKFVTDKLPVNFKWIGLIKILFPNAKIIHLIRNPMDTCLSNYRNYFIATGNSYAYDLKELANFFIDYRNIMEHWHKMFPSQIYACDYDFLTFNQESETRSLLRYCELNWQNSVLRFEKNKRSVKTASVGQVREGLYRTSVGNWEKYKKDLAPLHEILEDSGCLKEWDKTYFAE